MFLSVFFGVLIAELVTTSAYTLTKYIVVRNIKRKLDNIELNLDGLADKFDIFEDPNIDWEPSTPPPAKKRAPRKKA